jgi:hypothetical protein
MDTNNDNAEEVISTTPSINETESEKANSPTNMANASTDPMAPIGLIISNYQPQSEFSKNAMSTLLNAMDEIYNATPVEQELNYSNLIHMLRDDFPAASFITNLSAVPGQLYESSRTL